jgi:oligopeptide/dipeptide ABC transporter ATP-binding protein
VEAERRQVTVLFTDMVGFTTFSERSGEEAAFTLMRSLSKLMGEAVREQGGVVQGFTGDGIMAVFGAPTAFEDAPLRACRSALAILERLDTAGGGLEAKHGVRPQLRIGINTGLAVVGQVESGDAAVTVLGDTVNFAARLQFLAEPGSIFMSEATQKLVQGMVDATFVGEHAIKGKSERQKAYRLDAVRHGATRFEAAISRGLSAFVGRERELEVLDRALIEASSQLQVVDLVAEPGMGKSRLLHEFRQRIGKERAFVLSGSCSPDGQQTAFLPFIEVVRGSFRVDAGEAEKDVAQRLEAGLTALGLHSQRNLGLLLHLLGLKVPEGALTGLDGLLIGLHTRELLQQLLEVRCRLSPVVMVIEDLHWIDSVSAELLGKIIDSESKLRLLVLMTRRPEYAPSWLDRMAVTKVRVEPLPAENIQRLVQDRLGVKALPEALARQVTEKAEGNPLFAEEIVSFLTERGMLRVASGKLEFDANQVAAALPGTVQNLLTARVDRLALKDRAILQAASAIGRRFDLELLAAAVDETDINARLAAMQAVGLVRREGKSSDYEFKHALVRDALYQSLLTEPRKALHLKIAEEVERRSGNRLTEVAEVLAQHYGQTDRVKKAFAYLSMAGTKCLSVYSLDEATTHFTAALALLDKNQDCAADNQVADFLVSYTLLLNITYRYLLLIDVVERYLARIDRLGDDPRAVRIRHQYGFTLAWNTRYRDAAVMQRETAQIAERLGDSTSMAYSLANEIFISMVIAPTPTQEFEIVKNRALKAASDSADAYIQNWTSFVIWWEELHRGRMSEARAAAHELMQVGRQLNDPRSIGLGLTMLAGIANSTECYAEALEYSEQLLSVVVTPWDGESAAIHKGFALIMLGPTEEAEKLIEGQRSRRLLGKTEEGAQLIEGQRSRALIDGYLHTLSITDPFVGLCKVLQGDIGGGIHFIEEAILRREKQGYRRSAHSYRITLCEIYLNIIGGYEYLPLPTLLRNLPILLKIMTTASSRIRSMTTLLLQDPLTLPSGYWVGRVKMILGLLYKIKKKRALALEHLNEAKRILSEFGQTPTLARVDAALAELGQYGGRPAQLRAEPMLLSVEHLVVEYGTGISRLRAVSDVSFDLKRGETLGFVGESGCGKSSLARAVSQLVRPTSGKAIFDGLDLAREYGERLRRLRRRIQLIFQDPIASLNPRRRVGEIVAEPLVIAGAGDRSECERRVRAVLQAVGLDFDLVMRRRPHEFSGGQCQRISIARALVLEPELIICDEPVSALDVSIRAQILNLLEDMKARYRLTLIFIAHDLAVVKAISDRVAVMYLGKLCEIGPAEQVFETPAHPYTSLLLQAIPSPDPDTKPTSVAAGEAPSPYAPPSGCRFHTRCPLARARCTDEEPIMRELRTGQFVACHFAA